MRKHLVGALTLLAGVTAGVALLPPLGRSAHRRDQQLALKVGALRTVWLAPAISFGDDSSMFGVRTVEPDPSRIGVFVGIMSRGVPFPLVVDSAGKVRSAEPEGRNATYNAIVKDSAADWRFIPSLRDGRAVASQFVYTVSLKR